MAPTTGHIFDKDQGKLDEAISAQRAAISIKPEYADAHYHLGNVLADKGELELAMGAYREAIRLNPGHTRAHNNLGIVLRDNGQADEAIAEYRKAVVALPGNAEAHSNLILMMQYHPAVDRPALTGELKRWNEQHALPLSKFIRGHSNYRDPDRRLRVGYVSSDFREHVVGRNLLPLFAIHDHERLRKSPARLGYQPMPRRRLSHVR